MTTGTATMGLSPLMVMPGVGSEMYRGLGSVVLGEREVWTMGMHVLGYPELVMGRADLDPQGDTIIEVIRYVCRGDKPVGDGHVLGDEHGPRFQVMATTGDGIKDDSPCTTPSAA